MRMIASCLLIAIALMHGSAHAQHIAAASPHDNAELKQLFDADQADRSGDNIDWSKVGPRDDQRRARVRALLQSGDIRTSNDYRHAAFVFQHGGDVADIRIAHALATLAMTLDDSKENRWIAGASWDRIMTYSMQPQWYGTQFNGDAKGMYLFPVAEDAVSETERQRMVGHTLAESRTKVPEAAKTMGLPVREPAPSIEQLREEARAAKAKEH